MHFQRKCPTPVQVSYGGVLEGFVERTGFVECDPDTAAPNFLRCLWIYLGLTPNQTVCMPNAIAAQFRDFVLAAPQWFRRD